MAEQESLLQVRKTIKGRKPSFYAQDSHKRKEIKKRWRKSKGITGKIRLHRKGYPRDVSQGWRSPKQIRGFHATGYKIKMVKRSSDIETIDPKIEAAIIMSGVGAKKKIAIIEEAKKRNVRILNIKDADGFIQKVKDNLRSNKEKKAQFQKEKKAKEVEKKDKAKEKESLAEKVQTEDERKQQEKKEMDKVLIGKDKQ